MTMKHSYATGATLGTRAQYAFVAGTDSLPVFPRDAVGTFSVVANSSPYGANALQIVTSATAIEDSAWCLRVDAADPSEVRAHIIMDMPTMPAGTFIEALTLPTSYGTIGIILKQDGSWAINLGGSTPYTSATGLLTAGTRIRVSMALRAAGASSAWRACVYNDSTGAVIGAEQAASISLNAAATTIWSDLPAGKSDGTATSTTIIIRAARAETGPGCGLALLPAETSMTPVDPATSALVPVRFVSSTGTAPTPTGAAAITNLTDGSTGTTVVIPAASSIRVALRPVTPPSSGLSITLSQAVMSSAGNATCTLYGGNTGATIGTAKTVAVGTSAANTVVTWPSSDLTGVNAADWEALELVVAAP